MWVALDACASFCAAVNDTLGPTVSEIVMFGVTGALVWWRARKAISGVAQTAKAGIADANDRARAAKAEARSAHLQLAELRGSLRPVSVPPAAYPQVQVEGLPRPSMEDPALTGQVPLPYPAAGPTLFYRQAPAPTSDERDTDPETPNAKTRVEPLP